MRSKCSAVAVVVALGAGCLPALGQRQWIQFDGAVATSPGVWFDFARPTAVYNAFGELVPADTPRFHPPTLFCGGMECEDLTSGDTTSAIGAGWDADGATPIWIVRHVSQSQYTVHWGFGAVDRAYRDGSWSDAYRLMVKDASKQNAGNLLIGQTGLNGGSPDQPALAFVPNGSALVHNGLIVQACEVLESRSGNFGSSRVALAFTTSERLRQADPWIVAALGEPTDPAETTRCQIWSASPFPLGPDTLMVVWTDYRKPMKSGGVCYATRFERVGGEWTFETVRIARNDTPFETEHFHTGGCIRHPDGRLSVFVSTGDGIGDNRLMASTLAAGGQWSSGTVVPESGIDERSRIYLPSADWSPVENVWGGSGDSPGLRHNQTISMRAADPQLSALLCAADEADETLLRLEYDPDTRLARWTVLGPPTATSAPGDGVINYTIDGPPGGPYLSRIDAAAVRPWHSANRETRILYSPDGEHWGQCFVPLTTATRAAVHAGGFAYLGGASNEGVGLRRLTLPYSELVRPLSVAPSGENLLRTLIPLPTEKRDSGATITRVASVHDLPGGVPPPPCDPSNMFMIDNDAARGWLGVWYPVSSADDVPAPAESVLVRAWLYAMPAQGAGDPRTTAQVAANVFDATLGRLNVYFERSDFDAGQWCPLTLWIPAADFAQGDTWRPAVFLHNEAWSNSHVRNRFLIAWEGFYQDTPTIEGNGTPPAQTGADESATVEGFALPDEWTMLLVGMLPPDQWDNRVGGGPNLTDCPATPALFSLLDPGSSTELRLSADPRQEGIQLSLLSGSGETSVAETSQIYWLRGSPISCVLRARGGELALDYSVGGSLPRRLILPGDLSPAAVRLGPDAMLWKSVEALPYALPDEEVGATLRALSLLCRADFDRNGVVNTQDVLAFLNAWVAGDPRADFNHDGSTNTSDVLAFLNRYASGC